MKQNTKIWLDQDVVNKLQYKLSGGRGDWGKEEAKEDLSDERQTVLHWKAIYNLHLDEDAREDIIVRVL